jgi:dihydrofolate synthase/folylpolyglutamate synthase
MAFLKFREAGVEYAVVECGLGGRLDATNIVEPEVCAITSVGWDHMESLGDTLEKIAIEKAGIIKEGVPIVVGRETPH